MSKSKLHTPHRHRSPKKGTRKSSADRANIEMTQETTETLRVTRSSLRTDEAQKLRGRFDAFEETLSKLQSTMAPNGPRYEIKTMREEDVHRQIDWVNAFTGVLVKRSYLQVDKKKGKAWADQHRARYLGKGFFVILLDHLAHFVNKYHWHARGMSREKFLHECLIAVLKKTFSPGHKQAGETPLICDQAVKTGPTRDRLEQFLPNINFEKVTKGRDVVELLEDESFNLENDDTEDDTVLPEIDESKSVVSDQSSSDGSTFNMGGKLEFGFQSPRPSSLYQPPLQHQQPQQQVIFPSTNFQSSSSPTSWPMFPIPQPNRERFLERENERLKRELELMRSQLVARDMGLSSGLSYNFGTATMTATLPLPQFEEYGQQQTDVAMMDIGSQFAQPFAMTPTASQFS